MMRVESNHARGSFQQLRLALLGWTRRLYSLYYQIEAIKSKLEVRASHHTTSLLLITWSMMMSLVLLEHQLTMTECVASTVVPSLAVGTHLSRYMFEVAH